MTLFAIAHGPSSCQRAMPCAGDCPFLELPCAGAVLGFVAAAAFIDAEPMTTGISARQTARWKIARPIDTALPRGSLTATRWRPLLAVPADHVDDDVGGASGIEEVDLAIGS